MADEQSDGGSQPFRYLYDNLVPENAQKAIFNGIAAINGDTATQFDASTAPGQPVIGSQSPTAAQPAAGSASTPAAQPATTAQPAAEGTNLPAASVTSPQSALTQNQIGHAALICGYTSKDAPRQMTDVELARYHGVSPNIIAARPDAFYRRWVIGTTREVLPDSPVVCQAILSDPYGAGQLVPHVHNLVGLNQALRQGGKQEDDGMLDAAVNFGDALFGKARDLFADPAQYARDHMPEKVYDGIGHAAQLMHDNTLGAISNELTGIAHGAARLGGFFGSRPMALLDQATGSDIFEKWHLKQANAAESWLPKESENYRPVLNNAIYSTASGLGNGTVAGLKGASVLASAAPVAYDWAASKVTGADRHEASDWWYANTADQLDNQRAKLGMDHNSSPLDKVLYYTGSGAGMLPFIIPTRGAGSAAGFSGQIAQNALRVSPLSLISGINAGNDVFAQTGDPAAARNAMLGTALVTEVSSLLPISLPGTLPVRTATAAAITPLTSEAARRATNAALPENMQQGFSWENLVASGILNAGMAGVWPHPARDEAPSTQNDAPARQVDTPPAPELQGVKPSPDATHAPGAKEGEPATKPSPESAHGPEAAALVEQSRASLTRAIQAFSAARHAQELARIIESGRRVAALRESRPGQLQDIVQGMGHETGNRALTISAGDFAKAMEQGGITPQALQHDLPELHAQLQTLAPGENLQIPHTALARHPDVMEHVLPFARKREGAPNAVEALTQTTGHFDSLAQKIHVAAERGAAGEAEAGAASSDRAETSKPDPQIEQPNGKRYDAAPVYSGHSLFNDAEWTKYQRELQDQPPEDRAIAERFAMRLENHANAVAKYARLEDSQGGKLLDTDLARELSEDYLMDRSKSQVIQTLASGFVRKMFAEKLEAIERPKVLFSAGGPGSGKSTVLQKLPGMAKAASKADIVYDTTMSHYESARTMIEQVLNAGGGVRVALIIREPLDALVNGAMRRAMKEEKKYGSGRAVPLDYFLNAHANAIKNVFRLAEEYKGNPEVTFNFTDNTHGLDNAKEVSLEQAKKIEFKDIGAKARAALEKEYQDGKIGKKIYTGFKFGRDDSGGTR